MISDTRAPPARSKRLLRVGSSGGWLKFVYHASNARSSTVRFFGTEARASAAVATRVLRGGIDRGRPLEIRAILSVHEANKASVKPVSLLGAA